MHLFFVIYYTELINIRCRICNEINITSYTSLSKITKFALLITLLRKQLYKYEINKYNSTLPGYCNQILHIHVCNIHKLLKFFKISIVNIVELIIHSDPEIHSHKCINRFQYYTIAMGIPRQYFCISWIILNLIISLKN